MQFIACELNRWSLAEASVSTLLTLAKQNCSLSHWSNVARFITLSIYFKVQNGVLQFRSNNVANGVWKDGEKCVNVNGKATFERTFGELSKEFSRELSGELSGELSVQLSLEFTFGIDSFQWEVLSVCTLLPEAIRFTTQTTLGVNQGHQS